MDGTPDLLGRAKAGDPVAYEGLIGRISVRLLLHIRRLGGRRLQADFDAEDVLQTVLARAWGLLPDFEVRDGSGDFYRWMARMAENVVGDRVRYLEAKGRGGVRHLESEWTGSNAREPFDTRTSIGRLAARREEVDLMERVLSELAPALRESVTLHYLEGLSLSEVAARIGTSKNAAWKRLRAALQALRAGMSGSAGLELPT
jgi:RNA polymerase sigma factor (sigma-70 family)